MVAFGQLYLRVYAFLYVVYYAAQVAPACVGRDYNLAFYVLAVNCVRPGGRNDVGHVRERDFLAVRSVYHKVANPLHCAAVLFVGSDYEVEVLSFFIYLRYYLARHVYPHEFVEVGERYTVFCEHFAFWNDCKLGAFYLLLHVQVRNALNVANCVLYPVTYGEHLVQVVAEKLYGNACLRSAEHCVNPVADRLAYFDISAHYCRQLVPHIVEQFRVRAVFQLERRFYLRHIHSQCVFVQLGASGFAGHGLDFGDRQEQFFCLASYLVGFFKRHARKRTDVYGKRTLVERRKEAVSQSKKHSYCCCKKSERTSEHTFLVFQRPEQAVTVMFLEPCGNESLFRDVAALYFVAQQIAAENGSKRQGYYG